MSVKAAEAQGENSRNLIRQALWHLPALWCAHTCSRVLTGRLSCLYRTIRGWGGSSGLEIEVGLPKGRGHEKEDALYRLLLRENDILKSPKIIECSAWWSCFSVSKPGSPQGWCSSLYSRNTKGSRRTDYFSRFPMLIYCLLFTFNRIKL